MTPSKLPDDLLGVIAEVEQVVDAIGDAVGWAVEEIAAAASRHPDAAAAIEDSFPLLRPTHPLLCSEAVFRAHCVELLDRVAHGADTRPGTAVECCVVLSTVSLEVPLPTYAVGLYARMWRQAGLPANELADAGTHYEAIAGSQIDDFEADLRQRLSRDWRVPRGRGGDGDDRQ